MQKRDFLFILKSFFAWKALTLLAAFIGLNYLPLFSNNFLAGRIENYLKNPLFWGWANFDGEHYLSIAIYGYKNLQQAFFPLYPFMIRLFSFSADLITNIWVGIIISNCAFLGSLFLFWKIIKLDFSSKVAKLSIIALLVFPTSFYFGAVYTESLFLFLSLLVFYLYRTNRYFWSGLIGILMTLTRINGVFVLLMILVDVLTRKMFFKKGVFLVWISFLGILFYLLYLKLNYSDPFIFYKMQDIFGDQRKTGIILLPQVFVRYIKIFVLSKMQLAMFQTTLLEFLIAILFTFLPIYAFLKKFNLSYVTYIVLVFLTFSSFGSFSSIPRYVLLVFPAFMVLGAILQKFPKTIQVFYFLLSTIWLIINTALFIRGYWIA